jgi:hypothetical protein
MATWELTIDNALNASDIIYVMEDDGSGIITSPFDVFYPLCFVAGCDSNLAKRFYYNLVIGGDNFPPVCKEIAARGNGTLIVAENTQALKVWTYSAGIWTAKANITKNISDRATINIPSYAALRR